MYLQDDVVGGPPTTIMINRRAVEAGGLMAEDLGFRYFSDARWKTEIARFGDSALIHEPLVEYHQGEHVSLSSEYRGKPEEMDTELFELRRVLRELIPADLYPPPLKTTQQMVVVLRVISALKAGRPLYAFRRALAAPRPQAWLMAIRVALSRYAGSMHVSPRERLLPVD
jgi:hypothetical protein